MATIASLASEVILKVENRTGDLVRAETWLKHAILEISSNPDFRNEFDQLEVLGPTFELTIGTQTYAFSNVVPAGDINIGTLDVVLFIDPPTNLLRRKLRHSHYQEVDKFQTLSAPPIVWYRFADTIGFNPVPDKAYTVQARVLREHPFNTPLGDTTVLLPNDWDEILEWSAAMRGFMELLEYGKAMDIRNILHGDPKHPDRPGLIEGRKKRREREDWRHEGALRPVIRTYGWGSTGR